MNGTKIFFYLVCIITHTVQYAKEYIYPVQAFDDSSFLVIHQKSLYELELFLWDSTTRYATKQLSSFLKPTYINVLPDRTGFSFVDSGFIKIKYFNKRMPKTLYISQSITHISDVCWISSECCCFVGRLQGQFSIFCMDQQGTMQKTISKSGYDFLYPSLINQSLFYIVRDSVHDTYGIESRSITDETEPTRIIPAQIDLSLGFLHMESETLGYVLSFSEEQDPTCIWYTCYELSQRQQDGWSLEPLFSCCLPKEYMIGNAPTRLYESIIPFLPQYSPHTILYTHYADETWSIYAYDISSKSVRLIAEHHQAYGQPDMIFAPRTNPSNESLWYGYGFESERIAKKYPIFYDNAFQFELPHTELK